MRGYWPLVGIGLLGLIAAGVILAQSKAGTQPAGDVFSSSGAPDDRRKYVSPDGRFLDRCAYDTATIPTSADTRLYGMPDHVPLDVEIMKQYARCAVDACAVNQKAVCWGKQSRQNPVMPTSPDSFNSNGFTNCQADGMAVVCDPPKMLPILPAICLGQNALCETKVIFKLYVKEDSAKTAGYYDNYAKKLPAMYGKTFFQGTTLFVDTPANTGAGSQFAGPVKARSLPMRFGSAVGYIDPGNTSFFVITQLRDLSGNQVLAEQQTIRVYMRVR
jgi:hypothetical protein